MIPLEHRYDAPTYEMIRAGLFGAGMFMFWGLLIVPFIHDYLGVIVFLVCISLSIITLSLSVYLMKTQGREWTAGLE